MGRRTWHEKETSQKPKAGFCLCLHTSRLSRQSDRHRILTDCCCCIINYSEKCRACVPEDSHRSAPAPRGHSTAMRQSVQHTYILGFGVAVQQPSHPPQHCLTVLAPTHTAPAAAATTSTSTIV